MFSQVGDQIEYIALSHGRSNAGPLKANANASQQDHPLNGHELARSGWRRIGLPIGRKHLCNPTGSRPLAAEPLRWFVISRSPVTPWWRGTP
jgi:SLT domain-containing protein